MKRYLLTALLLGTTVATAAAGCPEGTRTVNFTTSPAISLTACPATEKFMGNQGVRWGIKNNTGDKLEVKFDKVYGISCGKQETRKADIYLAPHQSIGGGYFSGDLDLGDPIFPGEVCGKGAYLSSVAVHNLSIINVSEKERAAQAKRDAEERAAQARRAEEERRQEAQRQEQARLERERREQERLERERERLAEQQRRAEEERKRAVRQNLDYIDGIVNQQRQQSDAAFNSYSESASRKISELQNRQAEIDGELSRLEAEYARTQNQLNYELSQKSQDLRSRDQEKASAQAELNSSVDSYLDKFK